MLAPPPPKLTVKQWPSLSVSPLFINRRLGAGTWAGGGGENAETSAASPHSRLCQREISLEWPKESNAVFCERQRPAGYQRLFSLPWPLKSSVDLQVLFHLLKSLFTTPSLHISFMHLFLSSPAKITPFIRTICILLYAPFSGDTAQPYGVSCKCHMSSRMNTFKEMMRYWVDVCILIKQYKTCTFIFLETMSNIRYYSGDYHGDAK